MQDLTPLVRNRLKDGTVWFEAYETKNAYILHWKKAAKATLSKNGKILSVRNNPAAAPISLKIVQNMLRAYASSLRGKESLHATVLEKNGRAVALCAPSGVGKSTMAVHLLRSNAAWRLVTDDVAYLKINKSRVYVRGAPNPVLKLSEKTRRAFQKQNRTDKTCAFDPHMEKYIMPMSAAGKTRRVLTPLAGIYVLQRTAGQKKVKAEKLRGAKAALYLLANVYNEVLRPEEVLKRQFRLCASMAEKLPVYSLTVPDGMKRLNAVSSFFDNHEALSHGQKQAQDKEFV